MIEATLQPLTEAEVRWCEEFGRLFAALAYAEPRIIPSEDNFELSKLAQFFRKVTKEARRLDGPTARTEDVRRTLELACIAFSRAADQKTRNRKGIWTSTMAEGVAYVEQCSEISHRELPLAWED